jgi:hypothetical protein
MTTSHDKKDIMHDSERVINPSKKKNNASFSKQSKQAPNPNHHQPQRGNHWQRNNKGPRSLFLSSITRNMEEGRNERAVNEPNSFPPSSVGSVDDITTSTTTTTTTTITAAKSTQLEPGWQRSGIFTDDDDDEHVPKGTEASSHKKTRATATAR